MTAEGRNITTPLPEDKKSQLISEMMSVEGHQASNRPFELAIAKFEATPAQIKAWHYSADPLEEKTMLQYLAGFSTRDPKFHDQIRENSCQDAKILRAGAAQLLTSICLPEIMPLTGLDRVKALERRFYQDIPKDLLGNDNQTFATIDIFSLCSYMLPNIQLSNAQLFDLKLVADMLSKSATSPVMPEDIHPALPGKKPATNQTLDEELSNAYYEHTIHEAFKPGTDLESKLIGLDAFMAGSSIIFSGLRLRSNKFTMKLKEDVYASIIGNMTRLVHETFLTDPSIMQSEQKNALRGRLHEYLWYLDTQLYMIFDRYENINIYPASESQDRPEIGYPKINRAFDFYASNTQTHNQAAVQLKSRPQPNHQKEYHPFIQIIAEQNFMDINPNRLRSKLRAYQEAAQGEFVDKSAKRFLLPSAVKFIDDLKQGGKNFMDVTNDLYGINAPIVTGKMSRQVRRRIERQEKKANRGLVNIIYLDGS